VCAAWPGWVTFLDPNEFPLLGRCIVIQPRTNSVEKIIRVCIFATELFRTSLEFHAKQRPKPSNTQQKSVFILMSEGHGRGRVTVACDSIGPAAKGVWIVLGYLMARQ
jgi:hypothetical protein